MKMKKTSKSGIIVTIVIALVFLAILNVCSFAIPFEKHDYGIFLTVYIFGDIVIVAEAILVITQMFLEKDENQRIMGIPVVYYGLAVAILQLLATAMFYFLNATRYAIPSWLVAVTEVLIIGLGVVQIAGGFFFKERNKEYHEKESSTKFMDEFRARLRAIARINKNENIQSELDDLLDMALGSDPITNEKTLDSESELLSLLQELDENVKEGDESGAKSAIMRTKDALTERNVLCKAGK